MTPVQIIYTQTDEAPMLATYSLLPIITAFTKPCDIDIKLKDISLAARICAQFPENLLPKQQISDDLSELSALVTTSNANIIKLPNISASMPQLQKAIQELQDQGYDLPNYPSNPQSDAEKSIKVRYDKVLGSAVNPVLRQGNSDRRVDQAVKNYAQKHPHAMGQWTTDSQSHVAHMNHGDFYSSERSTVIENNCNAHIEFVAENGQVTVLKPNFVLNKGEIIDAAVMQEKALLSFFEHEMKAAKNQDVLLSLHLKSTMMKVSDPIIFGYAVMTYYKDLFTKHADTFKELGINPNNGIGEIYTKIKLLPPSEQKIIENDINEIYQNRAKLAMVDSDKGITNLHCPNDVIIDASMPASIRNSGKMWGPDGKLHDTKAMIPDRSYAGVYQETINFCKTHGAFDPATMGSVANVGLMAKKAEEYGSHDKTFHISDNGIIRVVDHTGAILLKHSVEKGDIWRMCQTQDEAIEDWVKLAVNRARITHTPAIFWLDKNRQHDAHMIEKVVKYLQMHDTNHLNIQIISPVEAVRLTLETIKKGKNVISVTGNVLRDYLTDLFPILELGTSAKMLSIVPLLAGGSLYETGAGGSAPKHVEQFLKQNHLRWDSLGEFLALSASLQDLARKTNNQKIKILGKALAAANSKFLENDKSPLRHVGERDTRGSHFYLALYWAKALAKQSDDITLQSIFKPVAVALTENTDKIIAELNNAQGHRLDIGGYYHPDPQKTEQAMRPSHTFNHIINSLNLQSVPV